MNQKKIGSFIAKCRKRRKLTQLELAEMLGVSNRSVSNWENGICLPDVSLYKPLCDVLEISINELFAGEFICDKQIADNTLLRMLEQRLYETSSKKISFDEFENYLKRISETTLLLKRCGDKEEAIKYLIEQTGLTKQECSVSYDFYMKLFK